VRFSTLNTEYSYFRLVIYNKDNKAVYSPIRKINSIVQKNKLQLAGNPVHDEIKLYSFSTRNETIELQIFNSAGQVVSNRKYNVNTGTTLIQIPASSLTPGTYIIRANMGNNTQETFRIIKQ
jgi:hypothetical protein